MTEANISPSVMFGDSETEVIAFPSTWKKARTRESSAQTSALSVSEVEAQTNASCLQIDPEVACDKAVQCEPLTEPKEKPRVDEGALRGFLDRVFPSIESQMKRNAESRAFDGYEVSWSQEKDTVSCSHAFSHRPDGGEYNCTGLSWNSNGSVIAASYGRFDHMGWCGHKGFLACWNLQKRSLNPNKPDTSLEVSNCLMCVSFHPEHPALIAGGTFNGELIVWNIGHAEDPVVACSTVGDFTHMEPLTQITWLLNRRDNSYMIATVARDGKVLLWSTLNKLVTPLFGFMLKEILVRGPSEQTKSSTVESRGLPLGGTSMSFVRSLTGTVSSASGAEASTATRQVAPALDSPFVIGTESGRLLKCSLDVSPASVQAALKQGADVKIAFKNPVKLMFEEHIGSVNAASCSPFHRNLVLSAAVDGSLRIYNTLQVKPVLQLEPSSGAILCAEWSPVRPLVFACADQFGTLYIFDLEQNQSRPTVCIDTSDSNKATLTTGSSGSRKSAGRPMKPLHTAVHTMAFNPRQSELLATGDSTGVIRIWQLSANLTKMRQKEMGLLGGLAEGDMSTFVSLYSM